MRNYAAQPPFQKSQFSTMRGSGSPAHFSEKGGYAPLPSRTFSGHAPKTQICQPENTTDTLTSKAEARLNAVTPSIVFFFYRGGDPGWLKNYRKKCVLFGSVPYPGRSSSTKPSCSKTELKRCTTTEIRWNKNEDARTSPVVSTNRQLPNSLKN